MRHGALVSLAVVASIAAYSVAAQAEEIVYLDSAISYDAAPLGSDLIYSDIGAADAIVYQDTPMVDGSVYDAPAADVLMVYEDAIIEQGIIDAAFETASIDNVIYVDDSTMTEPTYETVTIEYADEGTTTLMAPTTY